MQTAIIIAFIVLALAIAVAGIVGGLRSRSERKGRETKVEAALASTAITPTAAAPTAVVEAPAEKPRLRDRLAKTRATFATLGRRGVLDDAAWDDFEEALLLADVGMPTTQDILAEAKTRVATAKVNDLAALQPIVREVLLDVLGSEDRSLQLKPGERNVWMFVGVNGVGKTTTIGKLGAVQVRDGHKVLMAAADTFRAAAADQLTHWAEVAGADLVRGEEGADPGSIVFDAMAAAGPRNIDLVMIDTAGRLHTKANLMEELKKLRRIVDRTPDSLREVLLVIDASTGQNGLAQARQFADAVDVTGVVLTKLDGTAKGGIVLAIQRELGLPVKVVGVGEGIDDLVPFDPAEFVDALLGD